MTKIIGGSNGKKIAIDLSLKLGIEYIDASITKFRDNEISVQLPKSLYQKDIIIVQSTSNPVNDNLMELLLLIDAAKRLGSSQIIAVIPYFGYGRQDKTSAEFGLVAARLVANMLETAGINNLITMDLHSKQIEGAFNIGIQNIEPISLFSSDLSDLLDPSLDTVVVSPDIGGLFRAKKFADMLKSELVVINKTRNSNNSCEMNGMIGTVTGKNCIIIDDIIDSGSTLTQASILLRQHGAISINAIVTHSILAESAKEKIAQSPIDSILTTNSIPQKLDNTKFKIRDITPMVAEAMGKFIGLRLQNI